MKLKEIRLELILKDLNTISKELNSENNNIENEDEDEKEINVLGN